MAATGVIEPLTLPSRLEAAEPPEARGLKRDEVRLLVSRIDTDTIAHSRFSELPRWLLPGDLLVVNTSGTLNAALVARARNGDRFEVHLSTRMPGHFWVIEVRRPGPVASLPYRDARAGTIYELEGGGCITLLAPYPFVDRLDAQSRLWIAALELGEPVLSYLDRFGSPIRYGYVPASWPGSMYQTVFATEPGSAEMPSAARPFTPELVTRLISSGIQIAPLLLHTGVASLEDHEPPVRGVLSGAGGNGRARQCGEARRTSRDCRRNDGGARARNGDRSPGNRVRGRGMDGPRDRSRQTVACGQRHDHRLPRAARHASRDDRTSHRRRWRRAHRRHTSIARIARRATPDICGTSSATRT